MTLTAAYRAWRMGPQLLAHSERNAVPVNNDDAASRQLADLNIAWAKSLIRSPYARAIREAENLPDRFECWAEFDERVPVMDKARLRKALAGVRGDDTNVIWRATGGSTGEPFQFPIWPEEAFASSLDIWLGRSRLGIRQDDTAFLLWGHAHLLGSGIRGALNRLKRELSDWLLGYSRVSAYAMAPADLSRGSDLLLKRKPAYVVGYSSALDRFARHNAARATEIATLKLKAVVATAESFPRRDSADIISRTFGAPVFMEYGAVETGPLAYQEWHGGFSVFHGRHRLSQRGGSGPTASEILVTSLYPRAMPLMRYALGDLAETEPRAVAQGSLMSLTRIVGRCNDMVALPTGRIVHSEAFAHCLRDIVGIDAFQVLAPEGQWPLLRYTSVKELPERDTAEVHRRLAAIDPSLAETPLVRVSVIPLSVAGKYRMVVRS